MLLGDDIVTSVSVEDFDGQRFGVAKVLANPKSYEAIWIQWYEAGKEFGEYKLSFTPSNKPWTQSLHAKHIITKPFHLEGGHIPADTARFVKANLGSLSELAATDSDNDDLDMEEDD